MNEIPAAGETFRGDDGTVSTILPTSYGQDYEASEGELEEYAEYIGIDAAKEPELMWIAQEGLRAPLPDGWRACQTDENEVYYFNFQTGDSLWDHPMDEHYKNKVIAERAKHKSGGKGGGGAAAAALTGASAGVRIGTTKALTDSLFLKPAGATAGPLSINTAIASNDGASAPRPGPDVSDILSIAGASSPLGPAGTRGAPAPLKLKEAEAAVRKKLEEQSEAQLRALRVDYGKREDAERQRLEQVRTSLQTDLDAAWERERTSTAGSGAPNSSGTIATATQRRLQTAREVKQVEERWKSRLHDVATRVASLQQKVETEQQSLQKSIYQPPEELKKSLEARNAAEIAQLREAARRQNDVALQRLRSEHAAEQAKATAKAAETVATAEKLTEGTAAQKAQERKVQNAAMLATLQAALEAKQAELAAKKEATPADAAAGTKAPQQRGLSEQDRAAIASAQAAADAEVAAAKKANAAKLKQMQDDYDTRRREKEAALRNAPSSRVSSTMQTPTRGLSKASSNSSFSVHTVSAAEQVRLDEEDQKLREEAEKAARVYEEETELMVANREAGRPLTAAPLPAAAANVSAEAVAALSRTATQAQRARDAENGRHSMAVKQLEAKHEQAVRLMKTQHDKAMSTTSPTAATAFSPRQHPSFTAQLNARKRTWTRDHPTPSMEMPTLTPIPSLPAATMNTTMAAATMPDAEDQAKIVKTRVAQTREALRHKLDREVQALQREKEGELAKWQESYRAGRLAEVQDAMQTLRKAKDAEVAAARAKATEEQAKEAASVGAAQAAAASARQEVQDKAAAAARAKLQGLEEKLRAVEAKASSDEKEGAATVTALEAEIAQLESALAALTQQVDTEEKACDEHRRKSAAVAAETEALLLQQKATVASPPLAAAPSMALFIADAEAAAEEDALRARWTSLLASLRTAIQREADAYGRTLSDANEAAAASSHAESAALAVSSLPPTAPVHASSGGAGAAPLYQSSLLGAGGPSSQGYVTPLQRPPLSASADYRSSFTESGEANPNLRLYSPSPQQQQQQQQQQQHQLGYALHPQQLQQQQWSNNSGAVPSDGSFLPLNGSAGQRYFDAAAMGTQRGASAPSAAPSQPSASYNAYADASCLYPPSRRPAAPGTSPLYGQRSAVQQGGADDQAVRLAALQEAVRERRHELQAQRRELERLREEWKEDMRLCKEREDRTQARKLRAVKDVLEERAHQLNEAVLEVKAMQHEVQKEMRRYRQWAQQQQQTGSEGAPRYGAGNATAEDNFYSGERDRGRSPHSERPGGASATAVSTASVVGLLESIVARTERLENLLLRNAHSTHDSSPPTRRDAASR